VGVPRFTILNLLHATLIVAVSGVLARLVAYDTASLIAVLVSGSIAGLGVYVSASS
jgi:hypothetical protein